MNNLRLGTKVRALRRKEQLTQMQLAAKLEISPSYLNLIEHNQRPLPSHLLVKLAQAFRVDLVTFADDSHSRVAADLQEVFADPLLEEHAVTMNDVRELAENPAASRAILSLFHAYKSNAQSMRDLASQLYDGRSFQGLDPAHLPSEEASDVIQENLNYFPELEAAADEVARLASLDRTDFYRSLVVHLRAKHGIEVVLTPVHRDRGLYRRYDPETRTLHLSEVLPPWSRQFQVAHQLGLLEGAGVIDTIIERSQKNLNTPESVKLCRIALANYFAGALLMPYDDFYRIAGDVRYDIELLQHHYTASWEQVCHRLTTLRKPGAIGVSFHFVRVDIAGNISKRFSGTGIRFARFSGSCPRWDVHAAFLTPGRIRTQFSQMPDGTAYFCVARTIRKSYGYASGDALMAVGIGCPVKDARKLVYADGYDLDNLEAAVPIGVTCRMCERANCEQRAFPPLQHGLKVDENVRGRSFYAPVVADAPAPVAPPKRKRATPSGVR
ncbi:MAG: family transcriptional regulator, fatty acid utilization regulator [Acidobacteriota bacterium]|nr:family transcriptional regulator, fatty acid utilization regulator [Acidobacteriota bacterium]